MEGKREKFVVLGIALCYLVGTFIFQDILGIFAGLSFLTHWIFFYNHFNGKSYKPISMVFLIIFLLLLIYNNLSNWIF